MQWEPVIGLEIHTQLATESKIFSGASTAFGAEPNTQACAIDLGLPGVLPVLNQGAVQRAVQFGQAIAAEIAPRSVFARKNYFYPDLPKGYQISQYELPIVGRGQVEILLDDGAVKTIGVTRAHLEEDAGKSLHESFSGRQRRSHRHRPQSRRHAAAGDRLRARSALGRRGGGLRTQDPSAGALDRHQRRQHAGGLVPGRCQCLGASPRRAVRHPCRDQEHQLVPLPAAGDLFEIERQIDLLEDGGSVVQETRLYDADKDETRSMRTKEEANDYRYFPDPDLLPVELDEASLSRRDRRPARAARCDAATLPGRLRHQATTMPPCSPRAARRPLTSSRRSTSPTMPSSPPTGSTVALAAALNKAGLEISDSPVSSEQLAGLIKRIQDNTLSGKIAKQVFEAIWAGDGDADQVIEAKGLKQITDSGAIEQMIDAIIAANPQQVEQYRAGKEKVFGFFVGQVMKQSQGKANPQQVNTLLKAKLQG